MTLKRFKIVKKKKANKGSSLKAARGIKPVLAPFLPQAGSASLSRSLHQRAGRLTYVANKKSAFGR